MCPCRIFPANVANTSAPVSSILTLNQVPGRDSSTTPTSSILSSLSGPALVDPCCELVLFLRFAIFVVLFLVLVFLVT